ncbi:Os03g0202250 [Oryza sativa Japonica Group]|uniref:Os03g0202250 protein n=1 Tax=Oryza sativa subsp. japonica TaxID=39947 RepID=A0A0N7KGS5_ORYSJ|nr:hypothetical protein EE612_015963 [Oryza sativa]BAS82833.1 Os03g0202250 [Oryza sativa Japonica Group]
MYLQNDCSMIIWLGYTYRSTVLGKFSCSSVKPSFCTKGKSLSTSCSRKFNHRRWLHANSSGKTCILMEVLHLHLIVVRQLDTCHKLCGWKDIKHSQSSRDIRFCVHFDIDESTLVLVN